MDMLIASFLKTETGDFDVSALGLLILTSFYGLSCFFFLIPKALRERRVRFTNRGPYGFRGSEYIFERDKDPMKFWAMIVLFSFTSVAMIVFGVLISFGVLRKWNLSRHNH